jgi:hypothetical protein
MMKRVVVDHFGGPEVLRVVEEDDPRPGPGEVWKASPFPDCGNCILLSRYLRFQELIADLLRRPVPVR